jgi:hypothetical protein
MLSLSFDQFVFKTGVIIILRWGNEFPRLMMTDPRPKTRAAPHYGLSFSRTPPLSLFIGSSSSFDDDDEITSAQNSHSILFYRPERANEISIKTGRDKENSISTRDDPCICILLLYDDTRLGFENADDGGGLQRLRKCRTYTAFGSVDRITWRCSGALPDHSGGLVTATREEGSHE